MLPISTCLICHFSRESVMLQISDSPNHSCREPFWAPLRALPTFLALLLLSHSSISCHRGATEQAQTSSLMYVPHMRRPSQDLDYQRLRLCWQEL